MRKVFDGSYKKLNDDVSFQILRTNPILTTNTKLLYDGDKMYMESYDANNLLATNKFKHKRIWKSGLYSNDIKNFLNEAGTSAYSVGRKMKDTVVGDGDYSYQFENMYWCGTEEVSSSQYNEEFGVIAPIYLRKTLPNYFVIFKVDGPSNTSETGYTTTKDNSFNFKNNILNKCRIIKTFSLKEGTALGDYIRRYTSQLTFDYDRAIYVNYSTNDIYYYGIDINTGILTRKVEHFEDKFGLYDNTITHDDDWITNGFRRNNLIFPYIINLEFLFDDDETSDYTFCRYFGMYCDDLDLYKIEDIDNEMCAVNRNNLYYIKDKYDNLHSLIKYASFDVLDDGDIYNYYSLITNYPDISKLSNMSELYSGFNNDDSETDGYPYEFRCLSNDYTASASTIEDIDLMGFNDYSIYKNYYEDTIDDSDSETYDDGCNYNHEVVTKANVYLENACVVMLKKPENFEYNLLATDKRDLCISDTKVSEDVFTGYCVKSVNAYCNYYDGLGYANYMFTLDRALSHGDTITLSVDDKSYSFIAEEIIQKKVDNVSIDTVMKDRLKKIVNSLSTKEKYVKFEVTNGYLDLSYNFHKQTDNGENAFFKLCDYDNVYIQYDYSGGSYESYKSSSVDKYLILEDDGSISIFIEKTNPIGNVINNRFSCNGSTSEVIKTLCDCINSISNVPFTAKCVSNTIVIQYRSSGTRFNDRCRIEFSDSIENNLKITRHSLNGDNFSGGTDEEGCLFTIYSDDIIKFIGETDENGQLKERYIRTFGDNENAKITSYSYIIDDDGSVDTDYYLMATDENGVNVKVSDVKQVQILDKFYPYIGTLSFYPIMDFDFDTIDSQYCNNDAFKEEVENFATDYAGSDDEVYQTIVDNLTFDRLYNDRGNALVSEYDYYNENVIESLCTVSKTAPYIAKWGYVDGLDSCENPYRLNCSKIFGVDNFSANQFLIEGSLKNYTHSMPYYIYDDFENTSKSKYSDSISENKTTKDADIDIDESADNNYAAISKTTMSIISTDDDDVADIDSTNEYQYIYYSNDKQTSYASCVEYWKELFSNTEKNMFEEVFETKENLKNRDKRNTTKYSRFKFGSSKRNSETLFRGMKFEIVNLIQNGDTYKETFTNKYNDYKFSFLMVPVSNPDTLYFDNKVYFVKNDTFKYVVGFIVCNMLDNRIFSKSYVYSSCMGLIGRDTSVDKISGLSVDEDNIKYTFEYDYPDDSDEIVDETIELTEETYTDIFNNILDGKDIVLDGINGGKSISLTDAKRSLFVYRYCTLTMNFDEVFSYESDRDIIFLDELRINSSIVRTIITNLYKKFGSCEINSMKITTECDELSVGTNEKIYMIYDGDDISHDKNYTTIYVRDGFKGNRIIKDYDSESIYVEFSFEIKFNPKYSSGRETVDAQTKDIKDAIYADIYQMYDTVSAFNIKENVNNGYNVEYNSDDFKIKIIEPVSVNAYDFYESKISTSTTDNNQVVKTVGMAVKEQTENIAIKILNRYSGYYQPIFKDIVFYDDLEVYEKEDLSYRDKVYKYTNVLFDDDYSDNYGSFGIINNMYFHKVSDNANSILKSDTPYYPLTGDYALDFRDYNIFSSNWDYNYYTRQKDTYSSETLDYMASIDNGLYMFGSKYMNIPETIGIGYLKGAEEWNDDYLTYNNDCPSEVMYREVNSNKVEFALFIRNRVIRYFCELNAIKTEFDKWIDQEHNKDYGIKGTLDDDITDYVERNVLDRYKVSKITMYIKSVNRGVNDGEIENDYEKYFETDAWNTTKLNSLGFKENTSFVINDICGNDFDKKITYTLENGYQEYFIFKIVIAKK